jgi:ergothioneine biosynthesis protein EgtB
VAESLQECVAIGRQECLSSEELIDAFKRVRYTTDQLCEPLSTEDFVVQSMPDASPAKWHLAHSTWFFETFLLMEHVPGYEPFNASFSFLFNSYYNALGDRHSRSQRGMLTRPTVRETFAYRRYVNRQIIRLLEVSNVETLQIVAPLLVLGINHEQQHQELLLTDIKHLFALNPLQPVYRQSRAQISRLPQPLQWKRFSGGRCWIGHDGTEFAYDNEGPRHECFLQPFEIASRLVTNQEYLAFMQEGGYERAELWLAEGWDLLKANSTKAPAYWQCLDGQWLNMTLSGLRPVDPFEPVSHVNYFEASAFAEWSGARLPTEAEWEIVAGQQSQEGNFLETGLYQPVPSGNPLPGQPADVSRDAGGFEWGSGNNGGSVPSHNDETIKQMFGDLWEWTRSSYSAYPGYKPAAGALGEYNGKFMCNQFVLRGGSCATPRSHIRLTYRNFFPPAASWQFTGIRLARDS